MKEKLFVAFIAQKLKNKKVKKGEILDFPVFGKACKFQVFSGFGPNKEDLEVFQIKEITQIYVLKNNSSESKTGILKEKEPEILFDGLFKKELDSFKKIIEYFRDQNV